MRHTVCVNADLTAELNRCALLADLRFRRNGLPLYDQPTPPLRLKVRMPNAGVVEIMLYVCVRWSPTVAHLAILRTDHHQLVLRCIAWKRKRRDGYGMLSYPDTLAKTGSENVDTTVRSKGYFSRAS